MEADDRSSLARAHEGDEDRPPFDRSNLARTRGEATESAEPAELPPSTGRIGKTRDIGQEIADIRRWLRDDAVRRGKRWPRTHRELEIWRESVARRTSRVRPVEGKNDDE
jgi:hypothetical protein